VWERAGRAARAGAGAALPRGAGAGPHREGARGHVAGEPRPRRDARGGGGVGERGGREEERERERGELTLGSKNRR
jgi:hypothetical protein